jgi:hypothetical protein
MLLEINKSMTKDYIIILDNIKAYTSLLRNEEKR